ncbi:NAD(P)-dependent oxidoreductase [Nocardioides sp.]|uniref:NAD(P)-dependent oxidoreductase n=1 Tax=Nocardioides sp. TaxID=35761 RepID=UPI003D10C6C3
MAAEAVKPVRPRVVLTRSLADTEQQARLASFADVVVADPAGLGAELASARGLIAVWPDPVSAELLSGASRLQVIATVTAGSDHVDVAAAARQGVEVVTGIGAAPASVAEYVIWAAVGLRRRFFVQATRMAAGETDWPTRFRSTPVSREVAGHVLGIAGFGHIGRRVATAARSLGMRVLVHDPYARLEDDDGIEACGLDELFRRSDVVSLHVPLTAATRGLVGLRQLQLLGPEGYLVDVSRGGVLDLDALESALNSGDLGGVALDVYPDEPAPDELVRRLDATGRAILTPHVAGYSRDAASALCARAVDAMAGL